MIISHEHRYIFLAVPHTASTAIGNELCENYGGESILAKHSWLDELLRHSDRDLSGYFVFCSVRNPLDVVTTTYFRLLTDHDGRFTDEDLGLPEQRIDKFREIRDEGLTFTDYLLRHHRTTYVSWFLASLGTRADAVLRFENMATEFERVIEAIGLDLVRPLPRVNATKEKRDDHWQYVEPRARRHVMNVFGPFFEEWGYRFPDEWGPASTGRVYEWEYRAAVRTLHLASARLGLSPRRSVQLVAPLQLLTRPWAR